MYKFLKLLYNALKDTDNIYRSLFGYNIIHNIFKNNVSEINYDNWTVTNFIKLVSNFNIIRIPCKSQSWLPEIVNNLFFYINSEYIKNEPELDTNNNCYIFINGILSNESIVFNNKKNLENFLNKPINILHNSSNSLLMDLFEAFIGKETDILTEPSKLALSTIITKLLDDNINKVIIIAHSQGTIIISNVIKRLNKFGLDKKHYLEKLEIYCFATCCTSMKYILENYPYIEHFGNDNDIICKLGCNAKEYTDINGKIYINKNSYGHLLNIHYLTDFSNNFPESALNYHINNN